MRHFLPMHFSVVLALILGQIIIILAIIFLGINASGVDLIANTPFTIALLIAALFTILSGIGVAIFSILPLKHLISTLIAFSDEPNRITPPNPNNLQLYPESFRLILKNLYLLNAGNLSDATKTEDNSQILTKALDQTNAGVVVYDKNLQISYYNKLAPISLGSDNLPRLDLIFTNEQSLHEWLEEIQINHIHATKTWQRIANKLPGEPGRKIYDLAASYEKGSKAKLTLIMLDKTESYTPEEDELDFIAFAAHELRGPITVIRGYLDVLNQEFNQNTTKEQHELMERLIVSSSRLSSYINNILNASRFDRRHLKVHMRETSVADIYSSISDDMKLRAFTQNRLLHVNIPDSLPNVAADPASISEVFGNLIDNAIKYSNEGGIVKVIAEQKGDYVEVKIVDRGIGMPSHVVGNLFQKFYRSHRSRETVAGTGIGLYIVKAFVESNGGEVAVTSVEGEGSTFSFTLPIYEKVKDRLALSDNSNQNLIKQGGGWIKNHASYRG